MFKKKPNVLICLVDELRYKVPYESDELKEYSKTYIWNKLKKESVNFVNHYCSSTACVPSRIVIYTGQMPTLSGVNVTDGAAKNALSEDMNWLDPNSIPTIGHYYRAAGYSTHFIGKCHVTDPDLYVAGTYERITSYDDKGFDDQEKINLYKRTNRLNVLGFDSWIGPTPHGQSPLNSGASAKEALGRDQSYTKQALSLLENLASCENPWLLFLSYVNPHDIALFGLQTNFPQAGFDFSITNDIPLLLFNQVEFAKTQSETLDNKPIAQKSYRDNYRYWFPEPINQSFYHRVYYNLQKKVSDEIEIILKKMEELNLNDNTLFVLTSDHGDLLSSHGNMNQKWYNMYEETVHVPFLIKWGNHLKGGKDFPLLTSHLDLVPTLLGFCGIKHVLNFDWKCKYINFQCLPGRDLSDIIFKYANYENFQIEKYLPNNPIFFLTDDDISRGYSVGAQGNDFLGLPPKQTEQPNHIIAVFVFLTKKLLKLFNIDTNIEYNLFKYAIYYDYLQSWTNVEGIGVGFGIPDGISKDEIVDDLTIVFPYVNQKNEAKSMAERLFKTIKVDSQYEMYNLTIDKLELDNLADIPSYQKLKNYLTFLLSVECKNKRLLPLYAPDTMKVF